MKSILPKLLKYILCGVVLTFGNISAEAQGDGSINLNVLTFNLRYNEPKDGRNAWPNRKELAASVFGSHQVDLAGLQEALAGMVQDLQKLLPDYGWVGVGRDDGKAAGEYAPIFYNRKKLELSKSGYFWLSETSEMPSKGWDAAHKRIATWGIFHIKGTPNSVFFINTHFDNKGHQAPLNSSQLVIERIAKLHGNLPVIMTGDLNTKPDSPTITALTSNAILKLTDARQISMTPHIGGNQSSNEFETPGPSKIIDYIFVGTGIQVRSHGYYPTIKDGLFISDHWPVVSEITISGM